jgi:signal transduction histidine kinase/CheY-like chemotaxis protein
LERTLQTATPEFLTSGSTDGDPHTIILPLRGRGHTFAALLLSREKSGNNFNSADVTMAEALVSRGAAALDNARLYKDVEHADQQKNEFLCMLAHELRNPLAPIRNAVFVLRERQEQNPDARWAQDVIDRQVTNMVRLVDDLLDVSRITRGKIRLERKCLDVAGPVQTALETSRPLIDASEHTLTVELPDQPLYVDADEARLSQVLANLLNNAAKYTPAQGRIWLTVAREENEAVFRVRDNGTGISSAMLPRIFELFTQAEQAIDRSQGGLGIGLTLVQRLVEMHGGTVQASSDGCGCGSEFTVRLPAVNASGHPHESLDHPAVSVSSRRCRILVVDDNVDSAESLAKLLRMRGHAVQMAFDGQVALNEVRNSRPDVVVLDLGLPGMSGFEVARTIREESGPSEPLLIALSGYGSENDLRRSREVGFDRHFTKPVDFSALLNLISASAAPSDALHEARRNLGTSG